MTKAGKPVLRPDPNDRAWNEFCEALWSVVNECENDHSHASRLFEERGYDADASIALYEKDGGYCDCEILFNVDPPTLEDELDSLMERQP
jgi:hypothetical protein